MKLSMFQWSMLPIIGGATGMLIGDLVNLAVYGDVMLENGMENTAMLASIVTMISTFMLLNRVSALRSMWAPVMTMGTAFGAVVGMIADLAFSSTMSMASMLAGGFAGMFASLLMYWLLHMNAGMQGGWE